MMREEKPAAVVGVRTPSGRCTGLGHRRTGGPAATRTTPAAAPCTATPLILLTQWSFSF